LALSKVYFQIGLIYEAQQQHADAVTAFQQVLNIDEKERA